MIHLIGEAGTKRTYFFQKAAEALSFTVQLVPYKNGMPTADFTAPEDAVIKIDPPAPRSVFIDEIDSFGQEYTRFLRKLTHVSGVKFLNCPQAIAAVFDKPKCKAALANAGLPTPDFYESAADYAGLKALMARERLRGVFIKPRFGSGAAGVLAYRRASIGEGTTREVAYTTAVWQNGRLCNSKQAHRITHPAEIELTINALLKHHTFIEKWLPKASFNGKCYDIRVVWQFGEMAYAVARLAKGPISNLHLGGLVMALEDLRLTTRILGEIADLCRRAVALFPGLQSAGIDILLETHTLSPYIIEINGQGDLLYADIYNENRIYTAQLKHLQRSESV